MSSITKHIVLWLSGSLIFLSSYAQPGTVRPKAQRAFERANTAIDNGRYPEAIAALKLAIAADTGFAAAYQQLGDLYRKQQAYEQAIPYYSAVSRIAPTLTPLTWYGLGESLLFTGRYAEALPALSQFLATADTTTVTGRKAKKDLAD